MCRATCRNGAGEEEDDDDGCGGGDDDDSICGCFTLKAFL